MTTSHEHAEEAHHVNYVKVWAILVVLLVVSVCGPLLGIKIVTLITAFGIAVVKAYLVAKNFMHLNIERSYVAYLLLTMVGFMFLLFFGVSADVMKHDGQQWENQAAKAEVDRALGRKPAPKKVEAPAVAELPPSPSERFAGLCSPCHGMKGDGQGPAGAALNPKPANFTDPAFWQTRDKAHIEKVIREGGPAVGKSPLMTPFGSQLKADEISAMADYLQTLKK